MSTKDHPQIPAEQGEKRFPKTRSWMLRQLGLCFGLFFAVGLVNGGVGVQLPDLRGFYRLDNAAVSVLYLLETLGYAVSAFFVGSVVARLGLRRFGLVGLTVFGLSCLTLGVAPPLVVVAVSRFGVGFGTAIMEGSANLFVAHLPRPTALLNVLHSFFGAGSLVGPLVATAGLAAGWGWNGIYLVWLVFSLPLLLGCSLLFNRYSISAKTTTEETAPAEQSGRLMAATLRLPVVWLGSLFLIVYVGVELGMGTWAYTFLTEWRFYDPIFSGWAVSGYWFGITMGRLVLAPLTGRLGLSSENLIQLGLSIAALGLGIIWWGNSEVVSAFGLIVMGFGLGPTFPTILAILTRRVSTRLLPTTLGFATSLSILGGTIFPALAGLLADTFGLGVFLPYIALLGLVTVAAWLVFRRQAVGQSKV